MIGIHVAQQNRNAVHVVDHDTDFSVVEDISERGATANTNYGKTRSLYRGYQIELAAFQVAIKQWALGVACAPLRMTIHVRVNVAIDDKQILPSIVVVDVGIHPRN